MGHVVLHWLLNVSMTKSVCSWGAIRIGPTSQCEMAPTSDILFFFTFSGLFGSTFLFNYLSLTVSGPFGSTFLFNYLLLIFSGLFGSTFFFNYLFLTVSGPFGSTFLFNYLLLTVSGLFGSTFCLITFY